MNYELQNTNESLILKLIDFEFLEISINNSLTNYLDIFGILSGYKNDIINYSRINNLTPETFEMSFTKHCKFLDVWLLAYYLERFGLKEIFASRSYGKKIDIGSSCNSIYEWHDHFFCREIPIHDFLKLDPKKEMSEVIEDLSAFGWSEIYGLLIWEDEQTIDYDEIQNEEWEAAQSDYRNEGNNCFDEASIEDAFEGDASNTWNAD